LLPPNHGKLRRFEDVVSTSDATTLFDIYVSNKNKKLVLFVDTSSQEILIQLKKMIYAAHTEKRGLLFAFTFETFTDIDFQRLISAGFDDVYELGSRDERQDLRLYSWIRRFGDAPIPSESADRDVIARLGNRKDRRIGRWIVVGSDMAAHDDSGRTVPLTRQEIDFLTLLFEEPGLAQNSSYESLFKAPHAIVHKLKKKLGSDLPIQHNSNGRYCLSKDKVEKAQQ
jgi:hypothetical protein